MRKGIIYIKIGKRMVEETSRINALIKLGRYLQEYQFEKIGYEDLDHALQQASASNGWFTKEAMQLALKSWGATLSQENIAQWIANYTLQIPINRKKIGLVLAGNIPLVGFHDLICVWISGHNAQIKKSSKDNVLLPFIARQLEVFGESNCFDFRDTPLGHVDAVIATGSNNAARYFEYYFSKVPTIIRKNRNGLAVLTGKESKEELEFLGKDILQYYGLGCRNVSKILLPKGYDLNLIFGGLYPWASVIDNIKYAHNYDYNKAVFLMSEFDFLENGFFLLKQDSAIAAPIATAYYEYYENEQAVQTYLNQHKNEIQCVVGKKNIPFGNAQEPKLWEYADQVDTLAFLQSL